MESRMLEQGTQTDERTNEVGIKSIDEETNKQPNQEVEGLREGKETRTKRGAQ